MSLRARPLVAVDLGRVAYEDALALQRRLVEARRRLDVEAAEPPDDVLLLCEHDEVVTTGRAGQRPQRDDAALAAVRAAGIPVLEVERGGAATYHGPGQLVGYAIVRLDPHERDLHHFLRALEGAAIDALAQAGVAATRREGLTGVWVGDAGLEGAKVASIGVACRGWVTYHGLALNLDPDLSRFSLFRPCDLDAQVMTSLARLGAPADRARLQRDLHAALARRLGRVAETRDRGWL